MEHSTLLPHLGLTSCGERSVMCELICSELTQNSGPMYALPGIASCAATHIEEKLTTAAREASRPESDKKPPHMYFHTRPEIATSTATVHNPRAIVQSRPVWVQQVMPTTSITSIQARVTMRFCLIPAWSLQGSQSLEDLKKAWGIGSNGSVFCVERDLAQSVSRAACDRSAVAVPVIAMAIFIVIVRASITPIGRRSSSCASVMRFLSAKAIAKNRR